MPKPETTTVLTAEDIDRLWANAARPEDYPALRLHRVTQDDQAAGLPPEVVERAREAAETLSGRRRRKRRSAKPTAPQTPAPSAAEQAIEELMEALEVPDEAYDIGPNTVVFAVDDDEAAGYPPLPPGYGFKGGVARKALARVLRLPIWTAAVRDIDLLRDADTPPDHDRELAERYMTDDLIHGDAQVEAITNARDYFTTREVTVNQITFLDGEIEITHLGLLDTLGGVIRVTRQHLGTNYGRAHPIVAFKVLRFAANLRAEGREPLIPHFRVNFRRRPHPFAFFLALQLSRAFESGMEVAEFYIDYAREWGLLGKAGLDDDTTAAEAAELLRDRLTDYHLEFPESPTGSA